MSLKTGNSQIGLQANSWSGTRRGNNHRPQVASLVWEMPSQLHEVQGEVVEQLGYPHHFFFYDDKIPPKTDIILVQGPYGSISPLVRQLKDLPADRRPVLAYWWQQSMDLTLPESIRKPLTITFSDLYRDYQSRRPTNPFLRRLPPSIIASRVKRLGYMGDIFWLHENGFLDVLAFSSTVYQNYLAGHQIPSLLIPRGFHPGYGQLLQMDRVIPAVWMGKMRTRRRRRAVMQVKDELAARGKELRVFDGEENDFIFTDERTQILNQTSFVLNIFFSGPTDELSIRYFIAAANGAVILTEPGENRYPFEPGKHLLVAPIEEMAGVILEYLETPSRLQEIARNMLGLMRQELTLSNSIGRILDTAEKKLRARR
jgi:hypothetical protein